MPEGAQKEVGQTQNTARADPDAGRKDAKGEQDDGILGSLRVRAHVLVQNQAANSNVMPARLATEQAVFSHLLLHGHFDCINHRMTQIVHKKLAALRFAESRAQCTGWRDFTTRADSTQAGRI